MKSTEDIALEFLKNGNYNEAIALYSTLIANSRTDSRFFYYRALAFAGLNNAERELEDLNTAIEIKSNWFIYFQARGLVYNKLGRIQEALLDFDSCLKLKPDDICSLWRRCLIYASLGEFNRALHDTETLIDLNSTDHSYHAQMGYCYVQLQQFENAITSYSVAIDLFDKNVEYFNDRGYAKANLYIETGDPELLEDAIEDFSKALNLDDKFSDSYERRGYSKYLQALYLFNNGMAFDFRFNNVSFNKETMGSVRIENAIEPILNDALTDLFVSIKLDSQRAYAYYKISLCYNLTNRYEEAIKYINNALIIEPNNDVFISLKIRLLKAENKNL